MHQGWTSDWLREEVQGSRSKALFDWLIPKVVPTVVDDENELFSVAAAIVRTGLLIPLSARGRTMYEPTAQLLRLNDRASLGDTLRAEPNP